MKTETHNVRLVYDMMVRFSRVLSRSRYFRTLFYIILCGCILMVINIIFGLDLMNNDVIFRTEDSFLPLPPFFQSRHLSEMERKHNERMKIFHKIFEQHAKLKKIVKSSGQVCKHPHLDLKHDANRYAYFKLPPLNCSGKNLFYIENRAVKLNRTVLGKQKLGKCVYMGIERVTDDYFSYTNSLERSEEPFEIILEHDFIRIQCFLKVKEENNTEDPATTQRKLLQYLSESKNVKFLSNALHMNETVNMSNFQSQMNKTALNHSSVNIDHSINVNSSKMTYQSLEQNQLNNASDNEPLPVQAFGGVYSDENYGRNWRYHGGEEDSEGDNPWEYDINLNPPNYGVESSDADFDQFLVQVIPKPEVFQRISNIKPSNFSTKMNVLFLGIDSMSQLSYRRKLPKTVNYLKKLKSTILNGYNIVGDATTAALIPILTGKPEVELPEVRKSEMESEMVDVYPLIWKKFEEQGYATLFVEDEPSLGVFNLRLTGFDKPPTDHYMRPFWLAIWESLLRPESERFCTGKTPHHQFSLQYVKDFFVKYQNVSKFMFAFHTELSHSDNNPVQYIDEDLTDFLNFLNVNGYLDNTLLVLMADHGARYNKVRNTVQGKLEERLPMMSFRFPPWFQDKFPDAIKNLNLNAERLSTPFDIHETLLSVLDYRRLSQPVNLNVRAINLLQKVPLNRTCKAAGIDVHWCACLDLVNVDVTDYFVQNSALEIVSFINQKTENHRDMCMKLELDKIVIAVMVLPNEQVLRYRNSKDDDQREANFTRDINMDKAHYQLTIETAPNMGIYEATVEVDFRNETYKYNITADISRINRYGDQPKCVQEKYPNLRKYCFCHKNQSQFVTEPRKEIPKKTLSQKPLKRQKREHG